MFTIKSCSGRMHERTANVLSTLTKYQHEDSAPQVEYICAYFTTSELYLNAYTCIMCRFNRVTLYIFIFSSLIWNDHSFVSCVSYTCTVGFSIGEYNMISLHNRTNLHILGISSVFYFNLNNHTTITVYIFKSTFKI